LDFVFQLQVLSRETEEKALNDRIRNFRGVAITGWSRYDHFAVLCELLPVAIPSMLLSLLILRHQDVNTATTEMYKLLKCDSYVEVTLASLKKELENCIWDGKEIYLMNHNLEVEEKDAKEFIQGIKYDKGWLTAYNTKYNETNPWRVEDSLRQAKEHLESLKVLKASATEALAAVYPPFVIKEWTFQKFYTVMKELSNIIDSGAKVHRVKHWPRRPIAAQ